MDKVVLKSADERDDFVECAEETISSYSELSWLKLKYFAENTEKRRILVISDSKAIKIAINMEKLWRIE